MNKQQQRSLPPGPKPLPVIGNLLNFMGSSQLGYLEKLQRTYGNAVTVHFGPATYVMFFHPDDIHYILAENPRNFTNREAAWELVELIGDGLLTIDGEAHRQQRRLVQPAFHRKRVENYASIMTSYTEEMLHEWSVGKELDIARAMQELTLRIVAKCLFNVDLQEEVADLGDAFTTMLSNPVSLVEGLLRVKIDKPFTAYGRRMAAKRKVDAYINRLIEQRRATNEDLGDILSMLLSAQEEGDEQSRLSNQQVRDHLLTFFAAGHETTALALTWTFYLLSQYAEAREKLQADLQTVLQGRPPTVEDVARMPYLEWVINESMRVYPPAWSQGRRAIGDFDLGGYHYPAGTMFAISQWVTHRLPEFWGEDAEVFRPDRWDPVNGQKIRQWSYFPFGAGPRMCIGMPFAQLEAKLLLATILQQYVPRLAPGYKLELQPLITLRPKNGMPMILEKTVDTVIEGSDLCTPIL